MQRLTFDKWPQVKNWVLGVWARSHQSTPRKPNRRRLDRRADGVRDDAVSTQPVPEKKPIETPAQHHQL